MSSMHLAFSSDRRAGSNGIRPPGDHVTPLSSMREGQRGVVVEVHAHESSRADRLLALGVSPGATVTMLQTFPGVVFLCDQTELAVERGVAAAIIVRLQENPS